MSEKFTKNTERQESAVTDDQLARIREAAIKNFEDNKALMQSEVEKAKGEERDEMIAPIKYIQERLDLLLDPEERARFRGFDREAELLKKRFTQGV